MRNQSSLYIDFESMLAFALNALIFGFAPIFDVIALFRAAVGGVVMLKYPWLEDLDSINYCPTCRKQIDDFWKGDPDDLDTFNPEFCPYCGQHLDWTGTVPYGFVEEHEEENR